MPDTYQAQAQISFRQRRIRRNVIRLTPLIDVVFILLVFFMLASSFLNWRSIELNAPANASGSGGLEEAMLVEVFDNSLRLSGVTLNTDGLLERVRQRLSTHPQQNILVRPRPGVPMQRAVDVLDQLALAGVVQMSLIRERQR